MIVCLQGLLTITPVAERFSSEFFSLELSLSVLKNDIGLLRRRVNFDLLEVTQNADTMADSFQNDFEVN